MTTKVAITDRIQQKLDWSTYILSRDLILLGSIVGAYTYLPWETFTLLVRMYIVFLIVRYIISELTLYQKRPDNKKYFQISGHFGMFLLIVLFSHSHFQLNSFTHISLLVSFGLLNVATKAHTTVDILFTYLLVTRMYFMYLNFNAPLQP